MSFDVNVGRTRPMISPASRMGNDGGSSGNTGYMSRQKKKKQENSIFDKKIDYYSPNPFRYDQFQSEASYMKELKEVQISWIYKILQYFKTRLKSKCLN